MSGHFASEAEIVAVEREFDTADTLRTRVWRDGSFLWWAELWRPRTDDDPPEPTFRIPLDPPLPDDIPGFELVEVALKGTRRRARREAQRMAERYRAGKHPRHDPIPVEERVA